MPQRLLKYYQSKPLVSTNFNIITAGFLAIAIAAYPVHLVNTWIASKWADIHPKDLDLIKTIVATALDGLVDIFLYFILHWVANHWRPLGHHNEEDKARHDQDSGEFLKKAGRIQLERIAMAPLFYGLAMGGMFLLLRIETPSWLAFSASFAGAILITRFLHTVYWIRTGRFDVELPFEVASIAFPTHYEEPDDEDSAPQPKANGAQESGSASEAAQEVESEASDETQNAKTKTAK